jgi:hypothetical protein
VVSIFDLCRTVTTCIAAGKTINKSDCVRSNILQGDIYALFMLQTKVASDGAV